MMESDESDGKNVESNSDTQRRLCPHPPGT